MTLRRTSRARLSRERRNNLSSSIYFAKSAPFCVGVEELDSQVARAQDTRGQQTEGVYWFVRFQPKVWLRHQPPPFVVDACSPILPLQVHDTRTLKQLSRIEVRL